MKKRKLIHRVSWLMLIVAAASMVTAAQQNRYPPTPRKVVSETLHGRVVEDPYRWLEDLESEETKSWIQKQDEITRRSLEAVPGRKRIRQFLQDTAPTQFVSPPVVRGEQTFFVRIEREEGRSTAAVYRRRSAGASPELLISAADHGENAVFASTTGSGLPLISVSPDGRRLAYGITSGGSAWTSWFIYDLQRSTRLEDRLQQIHRTALDIAWAQGGDGFYYLGYPDAAEDSDGSRGQTVLFHRIGTPQNQDIFLMYRKGLRKNGQNPTWLYAYGANWAAAPWYQSQHRVFLEMGGVYAMPAVRGGGEYGESWRRAGSGTRKQRSIDDYLDAARWLIREGYASERTLIANGDSASGPLVAAALVQAPELFALGLIDYPLTDMLRYHLFRSANANFGTAENPEVFQALHQWSPYHNVSKRCYPPILIAQGDQDKLSPPFHSYKFTAALQYAQTCAHPIFLQVAWGQGHTVGGLEERANQLAFIADVLKLNPEKLLQEKP